MSFGIEITVDKTHFSLYKRGECEKNYEVPVQAKKSFNRQ
jgi:hypothetical protein